MLLPCVCSPARRTQRARRARRDVLIRSRRRAAQLFDFDLHRRDLALLRLHRREQHAGVAVQVYVSAIGRDRERLTRLILDDETEVSSPRLGGIDVFVRREWCVLGLPCEPVDLVCAELVDVALRRPGRDRAHVLLRRRHPEPARARARERPFAVVATQQSFGAARRSEIRDR